MTTIGRPTLDQLRVLLAVIEAGSFSAAARALNRRQSVVSYTIANLEAQLAGVRLFDRGGRRPRLTEAGEVVVAEARKLDGGMDGLRARVAGLVAGIEPELAVAVDVMMPADQLTCTLVAFRAQFPAVRLRLFVEALGSVAQLVLDGTCSVGASGPITIDLRGLDYKPLGGVRFLRVAAPGHPLAMLGRPVMAADAKDHVQLVLSDRSSLTRGRDFGVLSPDTWRLADLGAKHALLLAGLGWGSMPEPSVRRDIEAGRLVELDVQPLPRVTYEMFGINRTGEAPGPAARWFMERLAAWVEPVLSPQPRR